MMPFVYCFLIPQGNQAKSLIWLQSATCVVTVCKLLFVSSQGSCSWRCASHCDMPVEIHVTTGMREVTASCMFLTPLSGNSLHVYLVTTAIAHLPWCIMKLPFCRTRTDRHAMDSLSTFTSTQVHLIQTKFIFCMAWLWLEIQRQRQTDFPCLSLTT